MLCTRNLRWTILWDLFVLVSLVFITVSTEECLEGCYCAKITLEGKLLSSLICSETKALRELPTKMRNSTEALILSSNLIKVLPQNLSKLLPNLTVMDLDKNRLTTLPSGVFSNLRKLNQVKIRDNQIQSLGASLFEGTEVARIAIYLDGNRIEEINRDAFKGLAAYTDLSLERNVIKTLDKDVFADLRNMETLSLSDNQLDQLDWQLFRNLRSVFHLKLGKNYLTEFDPRLFQSVKSLHTLELAGNELKELPDGIFKANTKLEKVYLRNNLFTAPPVGIPSKVKILMNGNPIQCNCALKLRMASENFTKQFTDFNITICHNDLKNRTTVDYLKEINCETTTTTTTTIATTQPVNTTEDPVVVVVTTMPGAPVLEKTTKMVIIDKTKKNGEKTKWPIVLGALLGVLVLLVVAALFMYLYRKKIREKIVQGTLTLTRQKNVGSYPVSTEEFEYHAGGWTGAKTAMLKQTEGNI